MSKTKTPAKSGKADKLKELKKPTKKVSKKDDPIHTITEKKRLTTDELADKINRDLVIHYISVEPDHNFLVLNATDNNKKLPKEIDDTFQKPVHKKLINAIQKLRPHAAMMVHYLDASKYKKVNDIPAEDYADFNITSVHFKTSKSKGDNIQINATFKTPRGKAFNFTTPIEYLTTDDENTYAFQEVLIKIRQEIFDRVDAYMSGEERGDTNDIGLFKDAGEKTEAEIVTSTEEIDVTDRY